MVYNVKILPKFDGLNFFIWKVKMIIFLQSFGSQIANGDENTWSKIMVKEFEANAKTHYALLQALNNDDISRVINCTSAYVI